MLYTFIKRKFGEEDKIYVIECDEKTRIDSIVEQLKDKYFQDVTNGIFILYSGGKMCDEYTIGDVLKKINNENLYIAEN